MAFHPELLRRSIPDGPLGSVEEVYESQGRVSIAAGEANYFHFPPFFSRYQGVTGTVIYAFERSEVAEPTILEEAVINFDELCNKQFRAFLGGTKADISPGWRPLMLHPAARISHKSLQTLLGMSAHVVGDLVPLVAEADMNENYHRSDYTLMVGGGIHNIAHQTSREDKPLPDILLRPATNQVVHSIAVWREVAYVRGKALKAAKEAGDEALARRIEAITDKSAWQTSMAILYGGGLALSPFMASRWISRGASSLLVPPTANNSHRKRELTQQDN